MVIITLIMKIAYNYINVCTYKCVAYTYTDTMRPLRAHLCGALNRTIYIYIYMYI